MTLLDGKVALIIAGGSGIGRASALRFAREGARVVVADVQDDATAGVVGEVGDERALGIHTDVTEETQMEACVRRAVERFERVDIGLFAAGMGGIGRVDELESAPCSIGS